MKLLINIIQIIYSFLGTPSLKGIFYAACFQHEIKSEPKSTPNLGVKFGSHNFYCEFFK